MTEPTIYDRTGEARRALRDIFDGYGPAGADDARLVSSLLPDLLPGSPPEAKLLVAAATFRVATMLRERIPAMPPATAVRDVATLLAGREALDARACQWVVGEYALAMGHELMPMSPPPPQAPPPQPAQRYGMPVSPPPYSPPPQYSQSPPYSPPPQYSPPMSPQVSPGMPTSPANAGVPVAYPATQADVPPASPPYAPPAAPQYQPPATAPYHRPGTPRWNGPGIPGYPAGGTGAVAATRNRVSAGLFLGGALLTLISSASQSAPYPAYAFASAVVLVVVAVLLLNPRSAAVGEGAAIGAGTVAFANTLAIFDLSGSTGFQQPVAVIGGLVVLAATIVAMVSRRPLPRGPQVPGWIAVGLIAVLIWIITDNLAWVSGDGGSCCTLSQYSGWALFSVLMEMFLASALLIWAVVTGPTSRAVGILLGVGGASLVGFRFILLAYLSSQDDEASWTFAGWLKALVCGVLIVTALVMARRSAAGPPAPPQPTGPGVRSPNW